MPQGIIAILVIVILVIIVLQFLWTANGQAQRRVAKGDELER